MLAESVPRKSLRSEMTLEKLDGCRGSRRRGSSLALLREDGWKGSEVSRLASLCFSSCFGSGLSIP